MNRSGEGLSGGETPSKRVPRGEQYAGKLHVRFDEGAGVPHGASRSTLHPCTPSAAGRAGGGSVATRTGTDWWLFKGGPCPDDRDFTGAASLCNLAGVVFRF